jgi:hypothetical protein
MSVRDRYARILARVFERRWTPGATAVEFTRDELLQAADELHIPRPRNIGDLIYAYRYRREMPASIRDAAPAGKTWIIRPAGRASYRFVAVESPRITPNELLRATKIPDATPGIIASYALSDEQALLAKLRYNRLIDIFTSVMCYSLQSHLRTTVPGLGQVETDEVYIGVDRRGAHYVFPVQAKGGTDVLSVVQIEQDIAMCADKFPELITRAIGAQFMAEDLIALFEFSETDDGVEIVDEKHYRLVPGDDVTEDDLRDYAAS